jgi:hypothetical protein
MRNLPNALYLYIYSWNKCYRETLVLSKAFWLGYNSMIVLQANNINRY